MHAFTRKTSTSPFMSLISLAQARDAPSSHSRHKCMYHLCLRMHLVVSLMLGCSSGITTKLQDPAAKRSHAATMPRQYICTTKNCKPPGNAMPTSSSFSATSAAQCSEVRRQEALKVLNLYKFLGLASVPVDNKAWSSKRVSAVIALQQWPPYDANGRPRLPDPYDTSISKREWEALIVEAKAIVYRREYRRRSCLIIYNSPLYTCAGSPDLPNCSDDNLAEEQWEMMIDCVESTIEVLAAVHLQNRDRQGNGLDHHV